jgi:hypothetical protein
MTDGEGLSVPEAVEWCFSSVSVREIVRLRQLDVGQQEWRSRRTRTAAGPGPVDLDEQNEMHCWRHGQAAARIVE